MTTLREAATMALAQLKINRTNFRKGPSKSICKMLAGGNDEAIADLEAALAEPAQEPVAWRWGYRSITTGEMDWRGYVEIPAHPNLRSPEIIMQPLYAAPPQRKPLTEEELDALAIDEDGLPNSHIEFARAIERAHGIT